MAIQNGSVTGRLRASNIPVSAALRSPIVCGLFITFLDKYSNSTHDAQHTAISTIARTPKNVPLAATAGISEIITVSIILDVDISEC